MIAGSSITGGRLERVRFGQRVDPANLVPGRPRDHVCRVIQTRRSISAFASRSAVSKTILARCT